MHGCFRIGSLRMPDQHEERHVGEGSGHLATVGGGSVGPDATVVPGEVRECGDALIGPDGAMEAPDV